MNAQATEGTAGDGWIEATPSTHRDHVVAHVVGATVLGYFTHADALHMLLDIGFFWIVYLDAEMGLVIESLAISELDADPEFRDRIAADADALRDGVAGASDPAIMTAAPAGCTIEEVSLHERRARRRLIVRGEGSGLVVETSAETGEIVVEPCWTPRNEPTRERQMTDTTLSAPTHAAPIFGGDSAPAPLLFADDHGPPDGEGDTLDDAARDSKDYARQRLRDELGREPSDAEIDEWLRDHTESY